ncbi:MAG: lytic murein transglycosylase [Desulfoarculaceae bacterium]|nr:lytic murein transglycosylase [Desulfoarculaceae bacterium]
MPIHTPATNSKFIIHIIRGAAITIYSRFALSFFAVFCIGLTSFIPISTAVETEKLTAADLVTDGQAINLQQEKYTLLFKELREQHHFTQAELDRMFADVNIDKKVLELMDKQWEAKPYYAYWPLFITPAVIKRGQQELKTNQLILDRIEKELGVDREIVIAIWGIESRFGEHKGTFGVFKTLNTLFDAYPRRSAFFREQLVEFLLLCRENQFDSLAIKGSYAGAFGQTQFIPSSYREYAVSFDGDEKRDVFTSVDDILASIANYLRRFHWVYDAPRYVEIGSELKGEALINASKGTKNRIDWQLVSSTQGIKLPPPPGDKQLSIIGLEKSPLTGGGMRYVAAYPNFHAITKWNNSSRYAMAVCELAEALKRDR